MQKARKVPTNKFTPMQRRFIAALRSGQYNQTSSRLVRFGEKIAGEEGDFFCALGVACDVIGLKCDNDGHYHYNRDHCSASMPDGSYHKLHLASSMGDSVSGKSKSITGLNDSGQSFEQIADILEKYPARYFTNFKPTKRKK